MTSIRTSRLAVLATHLNGAADSGRYDHITTEAVTRELAGGDIFGLLAHELGDDLDLSKLTDVDRHQLAQLWSAYAKWYDTRQFHVNRNGLALLVAYLLHVIQIQDAVVPR